MTAIVPRPFDRDAGVDAYLDALRRVRDLAAQLGDDEWDLPTDLAGWSVADVVAHVNAVEADQAGHPTPERAMDWARFPHVRSPISQYTEIGVDLRRGRPRAEIVAELSDLVEERAPQLALVPDDPDAEWRGVAGLPSTVGRWLGTRTFDVWAHEQDIRRATDRPGGLTAPAALVTRDRIASLLPYLLAREVGAEPGTVVRWRVGEPLPGTVTATVGADGRGSLVADDRPADAEVSCDFEALVLLACGRVAPAVLAEAGRVRASGDPELAERVLGHMTVTP